VQSLYMALSRRARQCKATVKPKTGQETQPAEEISQRAQLLSVSCPSCKTPLRVPAAAQGKTVRCNKCRGRLTVPESGPAGPDLLAGFDFTEPVPVAEVSCE
jgi:LSD1 subclass zinc finger protein